MIRYTAKMQHNKETIELLSKTQYNTFSFGKKILQLLVGIVLVYLGVAFLTDNVLSILCLLMGCWLMTSLDMPAKHRASRINEALKGNYPTTVYEFDETFFWLIAGDNREKIGYKKLIRLVEDERYCYLYISRASAYMLPKSSLSDIASFQAFLTRKSGLPFTKTNKLATFSLRSLLRARKATR